MTDPLVVLGLGLVLGARHATDPDHVIAVTTIVARHRTARGAAAIGAVWGLGHSLTILVVGGAIVSFQWVIPPRVGVSMELAVAGMLIVLGLANLRGLGALLSAPGGAVQAQAHPHGDYVHTHPQGPEPEAHPHDPSRTPVAWLDRRLGGLTLYQLLRPLAIGVVHGLAGSAAVALLVLAAIDQPRWSVLYLTVFGAGTIGGMTLITVAIAAPFAGARRHPRLAGGLRLVSGLASVGFGVGLAVRLL